MTQLGLFDVVVEVKMLDVEALVTLLVAWEADPNNADLTAKVRAQCGPTDSLRQARDQLAGHRSGWAAHRVGDARF